jgi:acetylornithine/succinyldiaminopimelate/putrescine aminotransferase
MEKYRQTAGTVLVEGHQFVPFGDLSALHAAADDDTAAIVCETIQSLGGVKTVDDGFFFLMEEIAKKSGAMLIFDEVQSGLGRCGTFFFAEKVCAKPDMVTMAKGLASGLPVGALVTSPAISDRLKPGDLGSTFGGGPVPMAAMRATMQVIEEEQLPLNAERVGQVLMEGLAQVAGVKEVRGRGLLIGVEFEQPVKPILGQLIERGFIAGSSSDPHTMRLLPPLILTEAQAREFLDALTAVAQA